MPKLSLLRIISMIALLIFPFTAHAQESDCEVDVQPVVGLLIEAQSLGAQGNQEDALAKITEAQAALEAIKTTCSGEATPVELTQTFTSPDEYFTVDYPTGWVIGEYDDMIGGDGQGGNVFFASTAAVFDNIDKQPEEWVFNNGDVYAYVGVGSAHGVLSDALGNSPEPVSSTATLEALVDAFRSGLVEQDESFVVGEPEFLSLNDRKAAFFSLGYPTFSGLVTLTELEKGRFGVLLTIGKIDEAEQTAGYAQAIAGSLR